VNALSLFSGCGGMDLGLERAGITAVAHCEIDPKARPVLRRHWPDTPIVEDVRDVGACACDVLLDDRRNDADADVQGARTDTDGRHRAGHSVATGCVVDRTGGRCDRCGGFRPGAVDLVHGGFPCQDISVAGHRKGLGGERSGLWWEFHRILAELRPRWCVIENVAGLLSSNGGRDLGAILGALGDLGYGWAYRVLDGRHFGVPQRRRRVFIVGHLGGVGGAQVLLEPEGVRRNPAPGREAGEDVAALTANGVGTCGADDNQGQAGHLLPTLTGTVTTTWAKGPGNTQVEEGHVIPVAVSQNQRGEVRTSDTAPSLAVGGGKPGQGYPAVHDGLAVRRLTPVECERLMSYPDDWTRWADDGAEIADSHRYRMCGNGVVSNVAEWIGRRIVEVDR
jgi:DNA (cytosine-5)-methyltransferase 1